MAKRIGKYDAAKSAEDRRVLRERRDKRNRDLADVKAGRYKGLKRGALALGDAALAVAKSKMEAADAKGKKSKPKKPLRTASRELAKKRAAKKPQVTNVGKDPVRPRPRRPSTSARPRAVIQGSRTAPPPFVKAPVKKAVSVKKKPSARVRPATGGRASNRGFLQPPAAPPPGVKKRGRFG